MSGLEGFIAEIIKLATGFSDDLVRLVLDFIGNLLDALGG
jgi:hypothetical protein